MPPNSCDQLRPGFHKTSKGVLRPGTKMLAASCRFCKFKEGLHGTDSFFPARPTNAQSEILGIWS